jgi:predicted ester cyclase
MARANRPTHPTAKESGTMSAEENKALARRRIEEGLNKRNLAVLDETIANEGFRRGHTESLLPAFPDLQVTIQEIIAEGEFVAYLVSNLATFQGTWGGYAPTGKQVSYTAVGMDRIVGGKIVQHWSGVDNLRVLQDAGAIPDPLEAEHNKALVRRFVDEVLNHGRLAAIDELFAPDAVQYLPGAPEPARAPEAIKEAASALRATMPGLRMTVEQQVAEGDTVVTRLTARWQGAVRGVVHITRIAGGRIVEDRQIAGG